MCNKNWAPQLVSAAPGAEAFLLDGVRSTSSPPFFLIGNGPNTVSEGTVSNTELSDFLALTEFRGQNSVSSSRPLIYVPKRNDRVFFSQSPPSLL